jgi:hypothetical protein
MDITSEPRSPRDRAVSVDIGWTIVGAVAFVLVLGLLALLAVLTDLLPPAPVSEPVLSAPFRWQL